MSKAASGQQDERIDGSLIGPAERDRTQVRIQTEPRHVQLRKSRFQTAFIDSDSQEENLNSDWGALLQPNG